MFFHPRVLVIAAPAGPPGATRGGVQGSLAEDGGAAERLQLQREPVEC